jgi:uncharacterized membrane protein
MLKKFLGSFWLLAFLSGMLLMPLAVQAQTGKAQLALNVIMGAPPEVAAGQSRSFHLQVMNVGSESVTNIRFSALPPDNWTVEFDPVSIDLLNPGASTMIVADITPAAGAGHGGYDVSLMAQANETSSMTSVYLNVKGGITSWVWVGLALGVLAVGIFVLIFIRFGRR